MKITVAKNAGFCFGVKRAIDIALDNSKSRGNPIFMLGDIVHNENVVKRIEDAGIKKVKAIPQTQNGSLLIRAHGSSREILKKAGSSGLKVIDATCPMVKEIHKIVVDMDKKGYKIIVIGDHKHDEVQGIIGQIKRKAIVLEDISDIKKKLPPELPRATVVVQSTQNLDKVLKMQEILKDCIADLRFFNTVCSPTRLKQNEVKTLPQENDCVIVIGSKDSANTKRLYEIAKSLNPNSHRVNSTQEIRKKWFKKALSVGITAGASTPDKTIVEIKEYIQEITKPGGKKTNKLP